jgi:hypothetical protein
MLPREVLLIFDSVRKVAIGPPMVSTGTNGAGSAAAGGGRRFGNRLGLRLRLGRGSAYFGFGGLLSGAFGDQRWGIEQSGELAADPPGRPGQFHQQIEEGLVDRLSRCQPYIGLTVRAFFDADLDLVERG